MIAVIAGTGSLPAQACKSLQSKEKKFFVISLFPDDNLALLKESVARHSPRRSPCQAQTPIIQKPFYKTQTILALLKEHKTTEVLFIGKVDKRNLLKKFKLDWYAVKMLATLATKSDMSIMSKIEELLQEHGIEVIKQHEVLGGLFVQPGVLTGKVTPEIAATIAMGMDVAKQMSTCDVGQTVVLKDKMVLAVEAIEGTDACIARGIKLGKQGVVVCKTANANHNRKFDLPTIGSSTLRNVLPGQIQAIAWQSQQTFVADKDALVAQAKELGITLVCVE